MEKQTWHGIPQDTMNTDFFFNVRTANLFQACFSCHAIGFIRAYQQQVVCAEYFWNLYAHILFEVQEIFVFSR